MHGPDLRRFIRQAVGEDPVAFEDASRGVDHRVTAVRTARGHTFVLRVRTAGEIGLRDEAWALAQCAAAGVRVPAVHLVAPLQTASGTVEAMLQDVVPGRPLADVHERLAPAQLAHVLAQAGEQLAAIHGVKVEGFGRRRSGAWDFATWPGCASAAAPDGAAADGALRSAGLTAAEREAASAVARRAMERAAPPVLCHMDLSFEHIFVGPDLRLTGVIDFGDFDGAPRDVDLALFELGEGHAALDLLLSAYRPAAGGLADDFVSRLDAECVRLARDDLARDDGGDPEDQIWMVGILRGALRRCAGGG